MKITLIEPRASIANVYSKVPMPLLGPLYLGTILRNRGHEVEVYNENIYTPDYKKLNSDLIGISILTSTAGRGYEIAKKFPKEKVIFGGVHASLLPEESLQYGRQVIVGEAEEVIADVAEGKLTQSIVQGKPVHDLDSLPHPDFSLIKGNTSSLVIPISTSRGCPFDCSFCSVTKMFGRKYRFRSAENVIDEIARMKKKYFFFCDDNFAADPNRTRKLLTLMTKAKIKEWACQVRCDVATHPHLLDLMKKAGCSFVCVGFESVNQKTLQAYDKKQTVAQIVDAIRSFHKKKIKIHGMFVLGGDDDSKKTIWETLRFAIKEKIDTLQMTILTPLPGTRTYDTLDQEKRIFTKDWSLYDGQHIVFNPKLISAEELQANIIKAYAKFYSLSRSLGLVLRLNFRNAFFNMVGRTVVKNWRKHNHQFSWINKIASFHSQ